LTRVIKGGGWILDCCGDETGYKSDLENGGIMQKYGFEEISYVGQTGNKIYNYRKQVYK